MHTIQVENLCPHCGRSSTQVVPINKSEASKAMSKGRKPPTKEQRSEWGKKGAITRWDNAN